MARTRTLLLLLGIAAIGAGGYYYWHSRQAAPAEPASAARGAGGRGMGAGMAVPVTLAAASRKDLVLTLDALGTVQALNSVTLRSKVSGQLLEVLFQEGQDVEQGQVLARIDDRTYAASLAQAQAQRAYNQAQLANARLDLQRYEGLLRANGVTRQQVDTQRAQVAMYEAQLAQDQAAIDNARAQLDDTVIRAPFAGRVGLRQVDPGNLVSSSDTNGIVSLAQFTPIAVNFTLPQQELPRLLRAMEAGPVPVETLPSARGESAERGTLLTVGNTVDAATGTIQVKASFPNAQRRLWPGAFVSLRLPVETVPQAVVIPLVAVQQGPAGPFVFVAKEDQTIEQRSLRLGPTTRNEAAVTEGLQPGERVVTSGAQRLNNGSRIQEVTRPAAGAANAGAPGGPEAGAARSRAGGGGGNAAPGGASGSGPDGGAGGGRGAGTPPASTAPGSGAGGGPAQGGGAPASGGSGGARP